MPDTRHPESNNPSPFYVYPQPHDMESMLQTLAQFTQSFNSTEWNSTQYYPETVHANLKNAKRWHMQIANANAKTK